MSGRRGTEKFRWLVVAGAICMAVGVTAGFTICPVVKKIWTPSFALFSGAWTLWMLAAFYWIIDLRGWRAWAFPLVVFGVNSLVVYIMTLLWPAWIVRMLKIQFGSSLFTGTYGPIWEKTTVLVLLWLFCWWLYRRKLFFRI
jgi:predicted acyltransferase